MIFLAAALLAPGQALPWLDRSWLNEQARLEASASENPKRPLKPTLPTPLDNPRRLMSYENTVGM